MSADLLGLVLVSLAAMSAVLGVRVLAQAQADRDRTYYALVFPRSLTAAQAEAFLRTLPGLTSPRLGLVGRDAVVLELRATGPVLEHRLGLPARSAGYWLAQLRASVPGVKVTELENTIRECPASARELRRVGAGRPLSLPNPPATAATVLGAASGAARGTVVIWQWVITGGVPTRPGRSWGQLTRAAVGLPVASEPVKATDPGLLSATLRLGARAARGHGQERVARLRRAAAAVSVPGGRLLPRALPGWLVAGRLQRAATPLLAASTPVSVAELAALSGWPLGGVHVPGLRLGGAPQLPVSAAVPSRGLVLGDASVPPSRPVALSRQALSENGLILGPTGSGKTWLAAQLALQMIAGGHACIVIDPKGGLIEAIARRLPEAAIGRTVLVDPTDETRPVPLPLLARDAGDSAELAADGFVALLRHRYKDIGPRSSDLVLSSLYTLARQDSATIFDLFALWNDARTRAAAVGRVATDPALASFWAWFEALSVAERSYVLAPAMNKLRPLLARRSVRNLVAAPRATFSFAGALASDQVVLVSLPEGRLGGEATTLLAQVAVERVWAAIQARTSRHPALVIIDEAPRLLDTPTDLAAVLARGREYGTGTLLLGQTLTQLPAELREVALNSARTRAVFGTSARDARLLAAEFGPLVTADMFTSLPAYQAIGQVSLGGTVSEPFTFAARPLPDEVPGRLAELRAASRQRFGVDRAEIEASFTRPDPPAPTGLGPVGRKST